LELLVTASPDNFGCVGSTIKLRSGIYFDLMNPRAEDVDLADIAGALSKLCRFGGQCDRFYSVAEHSLNVHAIGLAYFDVRTDERARRALLLHDATEAYCGDMVKPLKVLLPAYKNVERRIERAIGERFGVDFDGHRGLVRRADQIALIWEQRGMMGGNGGQPWAGEDDVPPGNIKESGWTHDEAEHFFLEMCAILGLERGR